MTPEGGCGEDASGIPCPHVLVSFALPPAALFVSSDTDLFHPTPWGLDRGRHLPQQGSISPINLRLRLKGANWVCWLFEPMMNKAQVCRILRKVENESPMEREGEQAAFWLVLFPGLGPGPSVVLVVCFALGTRETLSPAAEQVLLPVPP